MGAVESFLLLLLILRHVLLLFFWEIHSRKKYSAQHFPISGSVLSVLYELLYICSLQVGFVRACPALQGGVVSLFFGRDDVHRWGFFLFFAMPIYIFILHPLHHYFFFFFFFRRWKHKMYTPPFFSFITSTAKFWLERIYRPFCPQGVTVKSTSGNNSSQYVSEYISSIKDIYCTLKNLFFFLFSHSCGIFESNLKKHTKKDSRGRCIF